MWQQTTAVGPCAPADRREERRASVRYRSKARGSCQTFSVRREAAWEADVRDISTEGIGLLLGRRFEPGSLLTIELADGTEGQQYMLLARVVHTTARPEGGWLIGCALLNPLTAEEVQALR